VLYLISVRTIAQFELRRRAEVLEQEAEVFQYRRIKRSQAYLRFVLLSVAIVLACGWHRWAIRLRQ